MLALHVDLGEACDAWADLKGAWGVGVSSGNEHFFVLACARPRADDGHLPNEDVDELGRLVDGGETEEFAKACLVCVALLFAHLIRRDDGRIVFHGTEFEHGEDFLVLADAPRGEEGMAFGGEEVDDGHPPPEEDKAKDDCQKRGDDVERALDE